MQSLLCNLQYAICYALFALQSLLSLACNLCYAVFAVLSVLCNLCYAGWAAAGRLLAGWPAGWLGWLAWAGLGWARLGVSRQVYEVVSLRSGMQKFHEHVNFTMCF